jgi:hypothetical protein
VLKSSRPQPLDDLRSVNPGSQLLRRTPPPITDESSSSIPCLVRQLVRRVGAVVAVLSRTLLEANCPILPADANVDDEVGRRFTSCSVLKSRSEPSHGVVFDGEEGCGEVDRPGGFSRASRVRRGVSGRQGFRLKSRVVERPNGFPGWVLRDVSERLLTRRRERSGEVRRAWEVSYARRNQ